MAFSLVQAKALCTAGELTLVKVSARQEIGKYSVVQIRQKVDRARRLRDKWRDLADKQRRTTQAAHRARQVDSSVRSADKAQLFAEVLSRFEAQLSILESTGDKGRPAPKRVPSRARSATHRAGRANIRAELKEERLALGERKKSGAPKSVKPQLPAVAATAEVSAAKTAVPTVRPVKPTIESPRAGRGERASVGTGLTALAAARELQGLHTTKGKQLRARSAAKQSRLQASGLMRVQKNAAARGKRAQGKRDAR